MPALAFALGRETGNVSGEPARAKSLTGSAHLDARAADAVVQRRERTRLRALLAPLAGVRRVRLCGHVKVAEDVRIEVRHEAEGPRARWLGLMSCGHVWDCPCCAPRIIAERAEELSRLVDTVGKDRVAMLTLTVRHTRGGDLKELVRGLRRAWRRMKQGRAGQDMFEGLEAEVSRVEVTHGDVHGWHPHIHVLLCWKTQSSAQSQTCLAPSKRRGQSAQSYCESVRACAMKGCSRCSWKVSLGQRWQACVSRELGESRRPLDAHGATYTSDAADVAAYIAKVKLALEVAGVGKESRDDGHRDIWEIAKDVGRARARQAKGDRFTHGEERRYRRDVALWQEFQAATRGVRMFTWSSRASALLACARAASVGSIDSRIDGATRDDAVTHDCESEAQAREPLEVALTDDEFELVSWVTRYRRGDAMARMLEAAEQRGDRGVATLLRFFWVERMADEQWQKDAWWSWAIERNADAWGDPPETWLRSFEERQIERRRRERLAFRAAIAGCDAPAQTVAPDAEGPPTRSNSKADDEPDPQLWLCAEVRREEVADARRDAMRAAS